MQTRPYQDSDYEQVAELLRNSQLYGGAFSEERDSKIRLNNRIIEDPESIWVGEEASKIVGTTSLIIDARSAWIYRFAVQADSPAVVKGLLDVVTAVAKKRGHNELLVYSDPENQTLVMRYSELGFIEGGRYVCYWIKT